MNDDQFTKLFKYIQERFDGVEERLDNTASQRSVDHLASAVDSLAKYYADHEVEQASRDAQFDRLLEWAKKVSRKTGVPLEGF